MTSSEISALIADLAPVLREAKRRTYAGLDDDATVASPQLTGSKQLEYRDGDWHYCDIYFGMIRFTGIEVVRCAGKPVWAMSYSGGVLSDTAAGSDPAAIYRFLRTALLQVDAALPLRGPSSFAVGALHYTTTTAGDLAQFDGEEMITRDTIDVYRLSYSGGLIG